MKTRVVFPAAALAGILLLCIGLAAPVAAQETATQTPLQAAPDSAPAAEPVQLSSRTQEILKLVRAQVHDDVIVAFIQNGNCRYNLTASEIIHLRKEGVSDRVLTAMLNPSQTVEASLPQAQPIAPATTASGSAPQEYAPESAAPAEVETASTLYVVPSTTYYYSYASPWYYSWYWPCWYPYYGYYWGWGDCHYGHYDNCHHSGYYPYNGYSGYYPYGNSPNGNSPTRYEVTPNSGSTRSAATTPRQQVTRPGNNNPTVPSASGSQANSSRSQIAGQTSTWGGRNSRTVAASPNPTTGGAPANGTQPGASRTGRSVTETTAPRTSTGSSRNTVWANNNNRTPTSRVSTPGAVSVPRSSPASPTTLGSRTVSQPASRYVAGSAPSYQRSSSPSPSYSYRSTTTLSPGPSTSFGGSRSMSTYQGGRSFGGGSAPRAASMPSGGGFRGGGGGGGGRSR
jgi:hypothetical protein